MNMKRLGAATMVSILLAGGAIVTPLKASAYDHTGLTHPDGKAILAPGAPPQFTDADGSTRLPALMRGATEDSGVYRGANGLSLFSWTEQGGFVRYIAVEILPKDPRDKSISLHRQFLEPLQLFLSHPDGSAKYSVTPVPEGKSFRYTGPDGIAREIRSSTPPIGARKGDTTDEDGSAGILLSGFSGSELTEEKVYIFRVEALGVAPELTQENVVFRRINSSGGVTQWLPYPTENVDGRLLGQSGKTVTQDFMATGESQEINLRLENLIYTNRTLTSSDGAQSVLSAADDQRLFWVIRDSNGQVLAQKSDPRGFSVVVNSGRLAPVGSVTVTMPRGGVSGGGIIDGQTATLQFLMPPRQDIHADRLGDPIGTGALYQDTDDEQQRTPDQGEWTLMSESPWENNKTGANAPASGVATGWNGKWAELAVTQLVAPTFNPGYDPTQVATEIPTAIPLKSLATNSPASNGRGVPFSATLPEGSIFSISDSYDEPDHWDVEIEESTGELSVAVANEAAVAQSVVPVQALYPNGDSGEIEAEVIAAFREPAGEDLHITDVASHATSDNTWTVTRSDGVQWDIFFDNPLSVTTVLLNEEGNIEVTDSAGDVTVLDIAHQAPRDGVDGSLTAIVRERGKHPESGDMVSGTWIITFFDEDGDGQFTPELDTEISRGFVPDGTLGTQGARGDQGPRGAQGARGETGARGATGVAGRDGTDGRAAMATTERGVDRDGHPGVWITSFFDINNNGEPDDEDQEISRSFVADGSPGAEGIAGKDGINGLDGMAGDDGRDGRTPSIDLSPGEFNGVSGTWVTVYFDSNDNNQPDPEEETAKTFIHDGANGSTGAAGEPGIAGATPHIGRNGNWFIEDLDTGVPATGPEGAPGATGPRGATGTTGATGPSGAPGRDGQNGECQVCLAQVPEPKGGGSANPPETPEPYGPQGLTEPASVEDFQSETTTSAAKSQPPAMAKETASAPSESATAIETESHLQGDTLARTGASIVGLGALAMVLVAAGIALATRVRRAHG